MIIGVKENLVCNIVAINCLFESDWGQATGGTGTGSGCLHVVRHLPTAKDGTFQLGSTDIEVGFSITIQYRKFAYLVGGSDDFLTSM